MHVQRVVFCPVFFVCQPHGVVWVMLRSAACQAQRELGVLLTDPEHRDMRRAVIMFEKAAEQQVLLVFVNHFVLRGVMIITCFVEMRKLMICYLISSLKCCSVEVFDRLGLRSSSKKVCKIGNNSTVSADIILKHIYVYTRVVSR